MIDSDSIQAVGLSPDHHGTIYSFETIRQGQPEPTKDLISAVYSSEFRLHVTLLQFQGFLSQVRKSFLIRIRNQLTNEYRYYSYESGIFMFCGVFIFLITYSR